MSFLEIGSKVTKESVAELSNFIDSVFRSAFNNRASEQSVANALNLFKTSFEVKNISLSYCNFQGGESVVDIPISEDVEETQEVSE